MAAVRKSYLACRVTVMKPERKKQLREPRPRGRIILEWIFEKWVGKAWNGLIWRIQVHFSYL
jgi:hypothetical protein